jgi:hypothetical protein
MNALRQNMAPSKLYSSHEEWQGSSPCRFKPEGIKIVPQILHEPKPDGGRKHYYLNQESDYLFQYKFGKKIFKERYSPSPEKKYKSGIKKIIPIYNEPKLYSPHRVLNPFSIRHEEVRNLKQLPSKFINLSQEYETDFKRKKLIPNIISMRNGMEVISPGEKLYKNVDYSPDFYAKEGWVVGSSNTINYKKHSNDKSGFYNSMKLIKLIGDNTYETRQQTISDKYDRHYVSNNLNKFDNMVYKK